MFFDSFFDYMKNVFDLDELNIFNEMDIVLYYY